MRAVLVTLLVGCVAPGDPGPPRHGPGELPGPSSCNHGATCGTDQVCARSGECVAPDQVRAVHAIWTLSGRPANATTCDPTPDLQITFDTADNRSISYAPVPCSEGRFTIDKLPLAFVEVRLGQEFHDGTTQSAKVDAATGDAVLDLPF